MARRTPGPACDRSTFPTRHKPPIQTAGRQAGPEGSPTAERHKADRHRSVVQSPAGLGPEPRSIRLRALRAHPPRNAATCPAPFSGRHLIAKQPLRQGSPEYPHPDHAPTRRTAIRSLPTKHPPRPAAALSCFAGQHPRQDSARGSRSSPSDADCPRKYSGKSGLAIPAQGPRRSPGWRWPTEWR